MQKQIQNLINHIVLVVDESGSMQGKPVVKVVDKELQNLRIRSKELDQETRISIYLFNSDISCLVFDMDVMRFESMAGYYNPDHQTALIDATLQAVDDSKGVFTKFGDHAFLVYVITDGQENKSRNPSIALSNVLRALPENWTVACLVPDSKGAFEAKKFGFPADSISVWDTNSERGFEKVGEQFGQVMNNYMTMRSTGVRGTKGLFTLDSSGLTKRNLEPVKFGYQIFDITERIMDRGKDKIAIKDAVEALTRRSYIPGSTFYEPTKAVKIQDYKLIFAQNVSTGALYGGENIRPALGLPEQTVEVNPGQHKDWRIFVQSTSLNRNLFAGQKIMVRSDY